MKRPSRRNSDRQRLYRLLYIVVGLLCLGLLLPRVLSFAGTVIMTPIHAVQVWFSETSLVIPALWREKLELQERVTELENELTFTANPSLSLQLLQAENQSLRALLGASTTPRTAAVVVARPGQLPYDIIQIDQGLSAGIRVGAPVYQNATEVIGLVSRVSLQSAQVTLFTTPGFETTAYLAGPGLLVRLEGVGGGVARVSVPQGVELTLQDTVHIPSIQPGVYGRIIHIENEPTDPQQFGYIVSEIPLHQLRYVSVGATGAVNVDAPTVESYIADVQTALTLPQISTVPLATTSTSSAIESGNTDDS